MRLQFQGLLFASIIGRTMGQPTPLPTQLPTPIPTGPTCMEELIKMKPEELKKGISVIDGTYHIDGKECVGPIIGSKYNNEQIYETGKSKLVFDTEIKEFKRRIGSDKNTDEQVNGKERAYFTKGLIIYHKDKNNDKKQFQLGCPESIRKCYIGFSKKIPDDNNGSFMASIKKRESKYVGSNIFLITLASCIGFYFHCCFFEREMEIRKKQKNINQENKKKAEENRQNEIKIKKENDQFREKIKKYAEQIANPLKFLLNNYGENLIAIKYDDLKIDNESSNTSLDKLEKGIIKNIEANIWCNELCELLSKRVKTEILTDDATRLKVSKDYFKQFQNKSKLITELELSKQFAQLEESLDFNALNETLSDNKEVYGAEECKSDQYQTEYDDVYQAAINLKQLDEDEIVKLLLSNYSKINNADHSYNKDLSENLKKIDKKTFDMFQNYAINKLSIRLKEKEYKDKILDRYYLDIKRNITLQKQLDIESDIQKMEASFDTFKNEQCQNDDELALNIHKWKDDPSQFKQWMAQKLIIQREQLFINNLKILINEGV